MQLQESHGPRRRYFIYGDDLSYHSEAGTDFDLLTQIPALAPKPLLLVAGARDETTPPAEHHAPLVAALQAAGAPHLHHAILDADHAFSQRRIALSRAVTEFLVEECR